MNVVKLTTAELFWLHDGNREVKRVVSAVQELGGKASTSAVADHAGMSRGSACTALTRAVEFGLLAKKSRGLWNLT